MQPKPFLCTCHKRFMSNAAMLQHQRDSPHHVDAQQVPQAIQAPGHMLSFNELVQRLSLQDREADHGFTPVQGGGQTTFFARNSDSKVTAREKIVFVAEGAKKGKKKTGGGNIPSVDRVGDSSWKVNPNTGRVMNLLEDQDWGLCDKDCGWCGHCSEGVMY